ncbi:hypothetical protein [Endozoicomonas sp. ONNA2]|uniref:hypothetical protein n=1 Tax=Endozoicomonas sp. ONNA2 TaxID=2828741 RepID=UPI002147B157|nr:hypothetical protein [Endozoicomonas sp. ONNA2]
MNTQTLAPRHLHQIKLGLEQKEYQLEQETQSYLKWGNKVIFLNEKRNITHCPKTPDNVSKAERLYNSLSQDLKELAKRKISQTTQPTQNLATSAHQQFDNRLPRKSKLAEQPRPTVTKISLSDAHFRKLQPLFQNGEAFFNDDQRAITSLDGKTTYSLSEDGCFKARSVPMELPDYEKLKSEYEQWETSCSTITVNPIKTPLATGLRHSAKALQPEKILSLSVLTSPYGMESETVSSKEQQMPVVISNYFSGYDTTFADFKKEHKALCDHMRRREVLGKLDFPEPTKDFFKRSTVYERELYQMFMVKETKKTLSKLIKRFESSSSQTPIKTLVAKEIAKLCIERSIETSKHLYSCKEFYDQAYVAAEKRLENSIDATLQSDKPPETTPETGVLPVNSEQLQACGPVETEIASSSTALIPANPSSKQLLRQAISILIAHQKLASDVSHYLHDNYHTSDFPIKMDRITAETNWRASQEGGPQVKHFILDAFREILESQQIIDTTTGDLIIPAAVAADPEDMKCFQTFAAIMLSQYKSLDTSKASRDPADVKDITFLLDLCQISLQTIELIEKCSKKRLATQNIEHTLQR